MTNKTNNTCKYCDQKRSDTQPKTEPEYYKSSGSRFGSIPLFVCGSDWKSQLGKEKISPQWHPDMTWENKSCTIYTSGTTGYPNGIVCPHRGDVLSYTYQRRSPLRYSVHLIYWYKITKNDAAHAHQWSPITSSMTLTLFPFSERRTRLIGYSSLRHYSMSSCLTLWIFFSSP